MTSRAERERKRKAAQAIKRAISLGGGASVPQKPQGRDRSHTHKPEDARRPVLQARCRIAGIDATPEAMQAAVDPRMGCAVGRMIEAMHPKGKHDDERPDLWQAVHHIRRVWMAYDKACGAPARHAQCLRILTNGEAFEASSAPVDDRPQEDRDRSAVAAWMALQGWLAYVDAPAKQAAIICIVDEAECARVHNWPGVLRALRCVVEGIKGQRITYRGSV